MAFPDVIAGTTAIPFDAIPRALDPTTRLHEALASETVDALEREGTTLRFRHRTGFHPLVPRPGGNSWLFGGVERGTFTVSRSASEIVVHHELSMRWGFRIVLAFAVLISAAIYLDDSPQHIFGPMFGLGLFALYAFVFARKRHRVTRWLRQVLTSNVLPAPAPLRLPNAGD